MTITTPRLIGRCSPAACIVLAFAASATAQMDRPEVVVDAPGLVVEATAGWDGTVDASTPIPVSLLFQNHSDRLIRGHVSLSYSEYGPSVPLEEIVLGPNTTRRFSTIQAMPDWHECIATFKDGERILWRRALSLATGKEFDPTFNFALLIDSTRRMDLPGGGPEVAATAPIFTSNRRMQFPLVDEKGKPVRCLSVKPWQLPNHFGPLCVAQAMVFPEDLAPADLNRVQWQSVAAWMCRGGTVFVHAKARKLIEQLAASAPLAADPPFEVDGFTVRRIGLGSIHEYAEPLFSPSGKDTKRLIGEITARLGTDRGSVVEQVELRRYQEGQRANLNRIMVIVFFLIYGAFSGFGSLVLFRARRKRVAVYITTVVIGACLLAGLLGGVLRGSRGDLNWVTVTQPGAGGAVVFGRINVQSAGGRDERVAIGGDNPDLQLIDGRRWYNRRYYGAYNGDHTVGYWPFTWQPNQAKSIEDAYQIGAPITPWGTRELQAMAFQPGLKRMDFELDFEPTESEPQIEEPGSESQPEYERADHEPSPPRWPNGFFSLKLVSHLPFDLTDGFLIIGVTTASAEIGSPVDVYQVKPLPGIAAGGTYEEVFDAAFSRVDGNSWRHWQAGQVRAPRLSRLGTASAWFAGHIESSPGMSIDQERSDFEPRQQYHIFFQEILPADMPDPSLFYDNSETPSEAESAEEADTAAGSD